MATTSIPTRPNASKQNTYTLKCLDLCGKLGIPNIGGQSGTIPTMPLKQQVDEIVKVYNEKYFASCEKNKVRILWEPYAGGPNIATGPIGWEALFKAFNDSPHVGLQFDPSHLVWQMMDPVAAAREFASKIYDVHLKDTEILWHLVKRGGIQPVDRSRWWRFRVPGYGSVDWKGFFSVLSEVGYSGAMNIENEDEFYYPAYNGGEFHRAVQARLPRGARIPQDSGASGHGVTPPRAFVAAFNVLYIPVCASYLHWHCSLLSFRRSASRRENPDIA